MTFSDSQGLRKAKCVQNPEESMRNGTAFNWDQVISRTRQNKYPSEHFVRFVARNYYNSPDRSRVRFLDLACGTGANSWYLAHEGFHVTALDQSKSAIASLKHRFEEERFFRDRIEFINEDVCCWEYPEKKYDCVLDHNSLCHVENPPYLWVWDTLKVGGRFFCVTPAHDTWKGTLEGKGYCRTATADQMREYLRKFSKVEIGKASYPDREHNITSLIIEATK